jgi:hypothetical protein
VGGALSDGRPYPYGKGLGLLFYCEFEMADDPVRFLFFQIVTQVKGSAVVEERNGQNQKMQEILDLRKTQL